MLKQIHERNLHYEVWELFTNAVNPLVYSLGCIAAFAQPYDAVKLARKLAKQAEQDGRAAIWSGVRDTQDGVFYNQYSLNAPSDIDESLAKIA